MFTSMVKEMPIIHLIGKEWASVHKEVLFTATFAGVANAAVLAVINIAAQTSAQESLHVRLLAMFALIFGAYVYCLKITMDKSTWVMETALCRTRNRIMEKIVRTDLFDLEQIGAVEINNRITQETLAISQGLWQVVAAIQAGALVVFITIYIALLSKIAFVLTVILVGGGIAIYFRKHREFNEKLNASNRAEMMFMSYVKDLLEGIKELKINGRRRTTFLDEAQGEIKRLAELSEDTHNSGHRMFIFSQGFFYVLMACIVFLLPRFVPTYAEVLTEITAAVIFIIGPLSSAVGALPVLAKINLSAHHILELEQHLEQATRDTYEGAPPPIPEPGDLICHKLSFSYVDRQTGDTFQLGPLTQTIPKGKITFLTGGNGSGKSTFLMLLAGLYRQEAGDLFMGTTTINPRTRQSYRELFSIVFTEFHLFQRLYGLEGAPEETVNTYLKLLELDNKTEYHDGRFTRLELSTGQRKRLALLIALLEDRPYLIFDEWAADQDPEFRATFYNKILPDLRAKGKTIIAASHDDHYFGTADLRIKMEYGQIEKTWTKTDEGKQG